MMEFESRDLMLASKMKGSPEDYSPNIWLAQPKWDGQRAVALRDEPGDLRFVQRNQQIDRISSYMPDFFPKKEFVVDGEWMRASNTYVVFDLLGWEGQDLRGVKLEDRLAMLHDLTDQFTHAPNGRTYLAVTPTAEPWQIGAIVKSFEMEGMVVKRRDSRYVGGRATSWQKYVHEHIGTWSFWYHPGDDHVLIMVKPGGIHKVSISEQQGKEIMARHPGVSYDLRATGEFRYWGWTDRSWPTPRYPKFVRVVDTPEGDPLIQATKTGNCLI